MRESAQTPGSKKRPQSREYAPPGPVLARKMKIAKMERRLAKIHTALSKNLSRQLRSALMDELFEIEAVLDRHMRAAR